MSQLNNVISNVVLISDMRERCYLYGYPCPVSYPSESIDNKTGFQKMISDYSTVLILL